MGCPRAAIGITAVLMHLISACLPCSVSFLGSGFPCWCPEHLLAPLPFLCTFAVQCTCASSNLWLLDAQDFVTRGGKFLFLYKRPGNRVILNAGGHMMVSPSALEASVQQLVAGLLSTSMLCTVCSLHSPMTQKAVKLSALGWFLRNL